MLQKLSVDLANFQQCLPKVVGGSVEVIKVCMSFLYDEGRRLIATRAARTPDPSSFFNEQEEKERKKEERKSALNSQVATGWKRTPPSLLLLFLPNSH